MGIKETLRGIFSPYALNLRRGIMRVHTHQNQCVALLKQYRVLETTIITAHTLPPDRVEDREQTDTISGDKRSALEKQVSKCK
jgi:hypothetical protein